MLRRHSSKKLDRRKSTSSTHSKHESIDPDIARRHAQAAATLAYNRALERNNADMGHRTVALSGGNGSYDHQTSSQPVSTTANVDHEVRRQQSVRFVGSNAHRRTQSIGARATKITVQPKSSTMTLRPMAMTTNAPVPAAYRPPSRSSSIGKASMSKATAESFVTANAFDEYYTREDDVASTPSSYRRIRRSKSMFSPLKAPSIFYTNGSPNRQESSYTKDQISIFNPCTSQSNLSQVVLRAPKSTSFLRSSLGRGQHEHNDEAVQRARDKFFQETTQQRLRERPSFLFRPKAQKQEKPFRKSVRSSSGDGYGVPIASASQQSKIKESILRDVARKASKSIKIKLRRVFGRSKDGGISIPDQQVDARESHVREYNGDSVPDLLDIPYPDEASFSHVTARNPSLHAANSNQQLRSYAGSVKSVRSLKSSQSDEKSRVTSWTSTGVNTLASQAGRIQIERDQQRLSIINEVGTHVPSSSFRRRGVASQFISVPLVHRPSKNYSHIPSLAQQGQVDSQRVYSALMKRLDENGPKAKLDASQKASAENFSLPVCAPGTRNSADGSPGSRTPVTIRHVMPDDSSDNRSQVSLNHDHQWVRADSISAAKADNMFGHISSHVHQWSKADSLREARMRNSDDVFSPNNASSQKSLPGLTNASYNKENMPPSDSLLNHPRLSVPTSAIIRQDSTKTSYHTVPEEFGLTPQELAIRNEPFIQERKGLRESRSTFFGGTSVTLARATSPYRRAMAETEHEALGDKIHLKGTPVKNPLYLGPILTSTGENVNYQASEKAYSDSVYSRATSGQVLQAPMSALSLPLGGGDVGELPSHGTGDIVILDRTVYRPSKPTPGHHRRTDSMSSSEWKTWMSSEVAKLERAKDTATSSAYINYALPTMPKSFHTGHIREPAQINDDDVYVAQSKGSIVKQPLGIVQQHPNIQNPPLLKPILKKRSTATLVNNKEQRNPSMSFPVPPPLPPTISAVCSPLRGMSSKSSLRSSFNTPNSATKFVSVSGRNMLHKRSNSQNTLRSIKSTKSASISIKSLETPAKLVKRNRTYHSNADTPRSSSDHRLVSLVAPIGEQVGGVNTVGTARESRLIASQEYLRIEKTRREDSDRIEDGGRNFGNDGSRFSHSIMGVSRGEIVDYPDSGMKRNGSVTKRASTTEEDAQARGSKMMVDMFLSSRRRGIVGGSEDSGGASSGVFI
jgi:hypothetical protein